MSSYFTTKFECCNAHAQNKRGFSIFLKMSKQPYYIYFSSSSYVCEHNLQTFQDLLQIHQQCTSQSKLNHFHYLQRIQWKDMKRGNLNLEVTSGTFSFSLLILSRASHSYLLIGTRPSLSLFSCNL